MSTAVADHDHHEEHHGPDKGIMRWVFTTNHKDIGTLYLWFSFLMFLVGGVLALGIRAELFQPGLQIVEPELFNQLTTMHGLIMVFGAVMPAFVGLANWLVPMMIGAPDMALPRMNNYSFWILPFAFGMLISTFFMVGGAPNYGWTFYAPLSTDFAPPSVTFFIFAIHMAGASSIMGSINIIVTILNMRAPGMTLMKMPLFVWTWLITAYLLIAVMPVLAGVVTMMLTDIHFGTSFFNAQGGGDPVLFQHVFWFFGHPEVYIMILPAFGVISAIIPTFARKRLFGYDSMVYATASIAFLSFIVWAHHMFTVGIPIAGELYFMYATMLIAVPTGVKVFNWVATMWQGAMTFETPMLFAIAFVILFTIGGFSGLMLAIVPADFQYHDTYFVVAHFHYVLVPGSVFAIMAAVYYWLPKWTGHMYDETLGKVHFWLSFIGVNVTFFPQHFTGLAGMPRRIPDYALQFTDYNMVSSAGAFLFGFSQILFLFIVLKCIRTGKQATDHVWEGSHGLEWTVPSPPPYHTFSTPPRVEAGKRTASGAAAVMARAVASTRRTVARLLLVVVGMFAFGFALVPLYDILCEITGFNGKTAGQYQVTEPLEVQEDRLVTVQFLASNNSGMGWEFRPTVRSMQVHPGSMQMTEFYARNPLDVTMVGQAVPSVTPFRAAEYLHKTECFCFEQQRLEGGESIPMPLRFIVDTALPEDVTTLTLSYTMYDVTDSVDLAAAN